MQATEALRITSSELVTFGVMDTIIKEPLGGAHADPMGAFPAVKAAIMDVYNNKSAPLPATAVTVLTRFQSRACAPLFLAAGVLAGHLV